MRVGNRYSGLWLGTELFDTPAQVGHTSFVDINLTPELERLVQKKVEMGRYSSVSEVVREALRLMEEREQFLTMRKDEIRKKIAQGIKSLKTGKGVDGERVFDRIERELAALEHNGRRK